jgi:hypothetical protein
MAAAWHGFRQFSDELKAYGLVLWWVLSRLEARICPSFPGFHRVQCCASPGSDLSSAADLPARPRHAGLPDLYSEL